MTTSTAPPAASPMRALMRSAGRVLVLLLVIGASCGGPDATTSASPSATPPTTSTASAAAPAPSPPATTPADGLLVVAETRDGDSFVASDGVEYRVGLINTPELSACGGPQAHDQGLDLLADGFTARAYGTDDNGRSVAQIALADGRDYGVVLSRAGYADDTYLEQFRHEAPAYATDVAGAIDEARQAGRGLWATCWAPQSDRGGEDGASPQPLAASPTPPPEGAAVRIADVVFDTAGNDMGFGDSEHVVIVNDGEVQADISGWTVEDLVGHVIVLPAGAILPAGGTLRVHSGPGERSPTTVHAGLDQAIWNNSGGDTATLRAGDVVIDRFSYDGR